MEHYGMPVHWGCMAGASFILSCMALISWDSLAADRIYRRLSKAVLSYTITLAPMAALGYTLYIVSCKL